MDRLTASLARHEYVGIDTAIFIYHVEGSLRFAEPAGVAIDALARGLITGVTSVLTLMELTVQPLRLGRLVAANEYEILLTSFPNLEIIDVDRAVVRRAAELRAAYRLKPADAIQVAASLERQATAFLTNDRGLRRVQELRSGSGEGERDDDGEGAVVALPHELNCVSGQRAGPLVGEEVGPAHDQVAGARRLSTP